MAERSLTLRLIVDNQNATASLNSYTQAVARAATSNNQLATSTGGLNTYLLNLNAGLQIAQTSFMALGRALDIISDVNELGQSVNIADRVFTQLAGSTGEAAAMLQLMQEKTGGVVSDLVLMESASKMLQMGLAGSNEETAELIGLATNLGRVFGMDANKAVSDFSLLLANMSFLRLDQFGLSAQAVRERIKELQAEFPGMSRQVAFSTAVIEAAKEAQDDLGAAYMAGSTAVERFNTQLENLAQRGARNVNYALENMLATVEALGNTDAGQGILYALMGGQGRSSMLEQRQESLTDMLDAMTAITEGAIGDIETQQQNAGLGMIGGFLSGGATGFLDTMRDIAEVMPEVEDNPFQAYADSLEEAARHAAEVREQTEAAAAAVRAMQSTGVGVDREGNKRTDQYDENKNQITLDNLVSVTSTESGVPKPVPEAAPEDFAPSRDAIQGYLDGFLMTSTEFAPSNAGEFAPSREAVQAFLDGFLMMSSEYAPNAQSGGGFAVSGGSYYNLLMQGMQPESPATFGGMSYDNMPAYDPEALSTSMTEAQAPAAQIATDMTTSAEQSNIFVTAMETVTGHTAKTRDHMREVADTLGALKKGNNDIPVTLVFDENAFRLQLGKMLNWFQLSMR